MDDEQRRAALYRIASTVPAEEGYNPARVARARELLGAMEKHAANTAQPEFVDQVDNGRASIMSGREGQNMRQVPAGNLHEGQKIPGRPENHNFGGPDTATVDQVDNGVASIMDKKGDVRPVPAGDYKEGQHITDPGDPQMQPGQKVNGISRALGGLPMGKVEEYVTRPIVQAGNSYLMGIPNVINDFTGADSPQARAAQESKHPYIMGTAETAGAVAPSGLPARLAAPISEGLRAGGSAVARFSPRVAALLGAAGRVPGGAVLGRAATGATESAALGAIHGAAEGSRDGLHGMLIGGEEGAEAGAKSGAVLGAGSRVAEAGANALRTPGVALAEKYGMEPGQIALGGGPLVRQGASAYRQAMEPPPLGVKTAGPASRQQAAIESARSITEDMAARENANQGQIHRERVGNKVSGLDRSPVPHSDVAREVDDFQAKPGMLPETRGALRTVGNEITDYSAPTLRIGSTTVPHRNATIPAGDLQSIAGMSYNLGRPQVAGMPDRPELYVLGARLKSHLPPEMQAQDSRFAKASSNMERGRESLGLDKGDLENTKGEVPLGVIQKAANKISRPGENTKAAANADLGIERLRLEGPPETMRGPATARNPAGRPARGTPEQIDYGTALDLPALHTAQEGLQLDKSSLFSGGWQSGLSKMTGTTARRLIYPELKRIGNAEVAPHAMAADDIVDLVKRRFADSEAERKKRQNQE